MSSQNALAAPMMIQQEMPYLVTGTAPPPPTPPLDESGSQPPPPPPMESGAGHLTTFMRHGELVKSELLPPHTDIGNDSTVPGYNRVLGKSLLVHHRATSSAYRTGFVGYGKHAAGQYLVRFHRYRDILVNVYQVWEELPRVEKEVGMSLFPDITTEPEGKFLDSPHTQKTVFYSSFRHAIRLFCQVYPRLASEPLLLPGLLFCTTVSPAPQHFWHELQRVIRNPGIFTDQGHPTVADMNAGVFARCFYEHLFHAKGIEQPYPTVNRHQPCHNRMATNEQFDNSLDVIARLIYELNKVPADMVRSQIGYYHSRALAILRRKCPNNRVKVWDCGTDAGVYCAGSLTSQHILGIAAGVGAVPECLLTHAEIASGTSSWSYLLSFGLEESKFTEHSEFILAAICHKLGIHRVQAEELCCATNQVVSQRDRPSEWIPHGAPIIRCLPPSRIGPMVECLHPNGDVTNLPPFHVNFNDDYFLPGKNSRGYWDIKTEQKLVRKKKPAKKGNSNLIPFSSHPSGRLLFYKSQE